MFIPVPYSHQGSSAGQASLCAALQRVASMASTYLRVVKGGDEPPSGATSAAALGLTRPDGPQWGTGASHTCTLKYMTGSRV